MGEALESSNYYGYRKEIRSLYNNDVANTGDLCSNVLQIRDKNKCISSISVAMSDYSIDVEFNDDTAEDKKVKIKDKIADTIGRYIVDNKSKLNNIDTNTCAFDSFLESPRHEFCDIIMVGNSIKFNL